jgi:hypothetical protein
MGRARGAVWAILLALLIGMGLGVFLPLWAGFRQRPKVYNTAMLLREVKTLSELITVEYVIERTIVVEVPSESVLGQMFTGENRLLMIAQGHIKAGLDLSQLQPGDIEVSAKKVVMRLPPARITDAYLDDKQTRIVERSTGFLRSFDKDLEQTTRQSAVDDIRRAARTGGILKDADQRARAQLKNLFQQLGIAEVEFK